MQNTYHKGYLPWRHPQVTSHVLNNIRMRTQRPFLSPAGKRRRDNDPGNNMPSCRGSLSAAYGRRVFANMAHRDDHLRPGKISPASRLTWGKQTGAAAWAGHPRYDIRDIIILPALDK